MSRLGRALLSASIQGVTIVGLAALLWSMSLAWSILADPWPSVVFALLLYILFSMPCIGDAAISPAQYTAAESALGATSSGRQEELQCQLALPVPLPLKNATGLRLADYTGSVEIPNTFLVSGSAPFNSTGVANANACVPGITGLVRNEFDDLVTTPDTVRLSKVLHSAS
jgi:hypothetical protein